MNIRAIILSSLVASHFAFLSIKSFGYEAGYTAPLELKFFAGQLDSPGDDNLRLFSPTALAADASGNLYVGTSEAGPFANTIRRISRGGVITNLAGKPGRTSPPSGSKTRDGIGDTATIGSVGALVSTPGGVLYFTDNQEIRRILPDGTVTTIVAGNTILGNPSGLAVLKDGSLVVSDSEYHAIYSYAPSTGKISLIAGGSYGSRMIGQEVTGKGAAAKFAYPKAVVVDEEEKVIFVADWGNACIRAVFFDGTNYIMDEDYGIGAFGTVEWVAIDARKRIFHTSGNGGYNVTSLSSYPLRLELKFPAVYYAQGASGKDLSLQGMAFGLDGEYFIADKGSHVILRGKFMGLPPTVFVPGIAGSELALGVGGTAYWPTVRGDFLTELKVGAGGPVLQPTRVVSRVDLRDIPIIGRPIGLVFGVNIYKTLIESMETFGHTTYDTTLDDKSSYARILGAEHEKPTFFPFPYDWRLSNIKNAEKLRDYLLAIKGLYPDQKIKVIAHSMGGMLLRRCMLEYGTQNIDKVVTVGTPYLGAPMAVERLTKGKFFEISYVDYFADDNIKCILPTFPSFHELLPSNGYLEATNFPFSSIFMDSGWDYNCNDNDEHAYTTEQFRDLMNKIIFGRGPPSLPKDLAYRNNDAFHSYVNSEGLRQDSPSHNEGGVSFLRIYGINSEKETPARFSAFGRINRDGELIEEIETIPGPGDGVVAIASARFGSYGPNTTLYAAEGQSEFAEHTEMMASTYVLEKLKDFLFGTQIPQARPAPQIVRDTTPVIIVKVVIDGTSFVRVYDGHGNENYQLSSISALRVPGVEMSYDNRLKRCTAGFPASSSVTLEGGAAQKATEVTVTRTFSGSSQPISIQRFRLDPSVSRWRARFISNSIEPDLRIDRVNSPAFIGTEKVTPFVSVLSGFIDSTPPTIDLKHVLIGSVVRVTLSGADNRADPVKLFYRVGDSQVLTYSTPFEIPLTGKLEVRAFSEDATGNLSAPVVLRLESQATQSRLSNLSLRAHASSGERSLILGFNHTGLSQKRVLIRGIGPGLVPFGLTSVLEDPQIRAFEGESTIATNNDWEGAPLLVDAARSVGAFSIPVLSKDAVLLLNLASGGYSVVTSQFSGGDGIALVEVYDADLNPSKGFSNLSARNFVGLGESIMVVGFTITSGGPKTLLMRAIGPTLGSFGVSGTLSDPQLQLYSGATLTAENDNWGGTTNLSSAFTSVGAFGLPTDSKDSAIVVTLDAGSYTLHIKGVNSATGVGLAEIYELR
jgi:pimeloyl-ACP methyl ester carboxylesterase